jgi:hypothetical protein
MESSVYLKARREWDECYAGLVLGKRTDGNWPTVLIIGPKQYTRQVQEYLER